MNRRMTVLGALGLILVVALWFMFLWRPAGDELAEAQDRTAAARQTNAALEADIARLADLELQRPQLQGELERLRAAIPEGSDVDQLIFSFQEAADASGVEWAGYTGSDPAPTESDPTLSEMRIQLTGSGGYYQVLDFLVRLSKMRRIVLVDNLSLQAEGSEDEFGPPSISWTIGVRTFVSSPAEPAPATTATEGAAE